MSLTKELAKSKKIDGILARILETAPENEPTRIRSLTVMFNTVAKVVAKDGDLLSENGNAVEGVRVRTDTGGAVFTADVSLEGLKNLIEDNRVKSISGNRRVYVPVTFFPFPKGRK